MLVAPQASKHRKARFTIFDPLDFFARRRQRLMPNTLGFITSGAIRLTIDQILIHDRCTVLPAGLSADLAQESAHRGLLAGSRAPD